MLNEIGIQGHKKVSCWPSCGHLVLITESSTESEWAIRIGNFSLHKSLYMEKGWNDNHILQFWSLAPIYTPTDSRQFSSEGRDPQRNKPLLTLQASPPSPTGVQFTGHLCSVRGSGSQGGKVRHSRAVERFHFPARNAGHPCASSHHRSAFKIFQECTEQGHLGKKGDACAGSAQRTALKIVENHFMAF